MDQSSKRCTAQSKGKDANDGEVEAGTAVPFPHASDSITAAAASAHIFGRHGVASLFPQVGGKKARRVREPAAKPLLRNRTALLTQHPAP